MRLKDCRHVKTWNKCSVDAERLLAHERLWLDLRVWSRAPAGTSFGGIILTIQSQPWHNTPTHTITICSCSTDLHCVLLKEGPGEGHRRRQNSTPSQAHQSKHFITHNLNWINFECTLSLSLFPNSHCGTTSWYVEACKQAQLNL